MSSYRTDWLSPLWLLTVLALLPTHAVWGVTQQLPSYIPPIPHASQPVNPGFLAPDGSIKQDHQLQKCLVDSLQAFGGVQKLSPNLGLMLINLTGKHLQDPQVASLNESKGMYAASIAKSAALFTAFQMRKDLRDGVLNPKSQPYAHQIQKIFQLSPKIEFKPDFHHSLVRMIRFSDNTHSSRVIS